MERLGILRRIFKGPGDAPPAAAVAEKNSYYPLAAVREQLEHFGVRRPAILVDELTDYERLAALPEVDGSGLYSFALSEIGRKINDRTVLPLLNNETPVLGDGWLNCAGNKFSGYSLNQFLFNSGLGDRPIIRYVRPQDNTVYYSYVDFFANEVRTLVHINNYLEQCYGIPFPLDLRYSLRDCNGELKRAGQFIIPPNGIEVVTSESLEVDDFVGYLEIEFNLASRITPFLHYMVDYETRDFISSNHQSGLGLHPAQSRFTRGYVPVSAEETLELSLFQRNYSEPVIASALLSYEIDGRREVVEEQLPPIHQNQLLFQDVKKLFPRIDFAAVGAPVVEVCAPVPLHRPNYYYFREGSREFYDTSHAGPDLSFYEENLGGSVFTNEELAKLKSNNCLPMQLQHFIFPDEYGIESMLGLGNDTTCQVKKYVLEFRDSQGILSYTSERELDSDRDTFFDFPELREAPELNGFHGTVALRAHESEPEVPVLWNAISAFKPRNSPHSTSTAAMSSMADNVPFYFRGAPPNYVGDNCVTGVTNIFARGIANETYDTYFALAYSTAHVESRSTAHVEIRISNSEGRRVMVNREIEPNGCLYIKLSDIIRETGMKSRNGYYTAWFLGMGVHIYGQHFLYRLRDGALSVEHCYVGRFGL